MFSFNFMLEQSHYFVILTGTSLQMPQLNFLNKTLLVRLCNPCRFAGRLLSLLHSVEGGCFLMTSNNLTERQPHIPIINQELEIPLRSRLGARKKELGSHGCQAASHFKSTFKRRVCCQVSTRDVWIDKSKHLCSDYMVYIFTVTQLHQLFHY